MSSSFIGEIRILPYMRGAPSGWQICDGSLLQISGNETLFQLLGVTYGGDGQTNFGVPDLRARVPVHQGQGAGLSPRNLGQVAGDDTVTLNTQQMGQHNHFLMASTADATSASPGAMVLAAVPSSLGDSFYATAPAQAPTVGFPATMVIPTGGNQPHDNTAPTQAMQYCIATDGIYPVQQ